ncbi:PGF-pre-PGF domain-containing protein, partial [Candidatus Woesearchaeota archaeon]|nr:PGF-pre-PGF domain-containing protein [Candidatus Woesearchaeota archaeon]
TALVNKTIYTTAIYSINFTSLPRTTYLYNATIYDKASNYNWTSIRTITLVQDATPPNINLRSPADGASWTTSSTVTFTYNVSDDNPIRNCSLIINGVIDQTDVTITRNISQTFTKSLANADHNWSVTCYDNLENQGNSSVYNLTVNYVSSSTPGSTGGGGGGSGSGGGGGSVPALADNIKTKTWYEVYKGKEIEWEIGDFTVTSLKADIERDSSEAKITVTLLEEKPENISAVDNPYHYFEITTQNMNVKKADIQFRVDRSWAAGKEIILSRYNRGWADIPTRYTRRDLTYNYYNAETKGFSYFAIRGESIEKEEDLTVKEDIIQNETQEEIEKPIRLGQKKNTARNIVIFAIEMIIIISLARVIMVYKKKRARIRRIRK